MDLKKLPTCRGYEYACNVVDCFSRFAMGGPIKSKSAKEVCRVLLDDCIYKYGLPIILQTDNGGEFNNARLTEVLEEMKALKINGRPYHPQSQGRVERFNQALTRFLRRDLQKEKDWPSRLPFFYFMYNTRVHRSLQGETPADLFHRRPTLVCTQSRAATTSRRKRRSSSWMPIWMSERRTTPVKPQQRKAW